MQKYEEKLPNQSEMIQNDVKMSQTLSQPLQNHTTNQPATSCETFRGFATPTVVGKPSLFKSRKETSDSFQMFKCFQWNRQCVLWFEVCSFPSHHPAQHEFDGAAMSFWFQSYTKKSWKFLLSSFESAGHVHQIYWPILNKHATKHPRGADS